MNDYVIDLDEMNPPGMSIHDGGRWFTIMIPEPPDIIVGVAYAKGTAKFTVDDFGKKRRLEGTIESILWYGGPVLEIKVYVPTSA